MSLLKDYVQSLLLKVTLSQYLTQEQLEEDKSEMAGLAISGLVASVYFSSWCIC